MLLENLAEKMILNNTEYFLMMLNRVINHVYYVTLKKFMKKL